VIRVILGLVSLLLTMQEWPSEVIIPPVLVSQCGARYTEEARSARLEGKVILSAEVLADGRVDSVKVTRPLGMGLDANAMEAVKQWRFRPGTRNGKPESRPVSLEVNFRLTNVAKPCSAAWPKP
jgi:periplasmic protein TonB